MGISSHNKKAKTTNQNSMADDLRNSECSSFEDFECVSLGEFGYMEYKVKSLYGYLKVIQILSEDKELWFRGHSCRNYKLQPNLYRGKDSISEDDLRTIEVKLNRRFRDRSMPYGLQGRDESSEKSGLQSWWRLFTMQHYGTPTRLLDWSENAITALCFAVLDAHQKGDLKDDAAVWVLDPILWNNMGNTNNRKISSIDDHEVKAYAPLPSEGQHIQSLWPVAIYGMHNSPRIAIQQGAFVVFAPGKSKSMESLASSPEYQEKSKKALSCITIDKNSIISISQQLRRLGFRHSMLYPDLQGLAIDLKNEVD